MAGLLDAAAAAGVPAVRIGTTGGESLDIAGGRKSTSCSRCAELTEVWREPLRRIFA